MQWLTAKPDTRAARAARDRRSPLRFLIPQRRRIRANCGRRRRRCAAEASTCAMPPNNHQVASRVPAHLFRVVATK